MLREVERSAAPVGGAAARGNARGVASTVPLMAVSSDEESVSDHEDPEGPAIVAPFDSTAASLQLQSEFQELWPRWKKQSKRLNYSELFPKLKIPAGTKLRDLEPINHLLPMNIGSLLETMDDENCFGFLPKMGLARLGNNLASSFVERMNSAAKLCMTEGRTLLSEHHLEMIVLLRINKEFMYFMKKKFPKLVLDLIKRQEDEL